MIARKADECRHILLDESPDRFKRMPVAPIRRRRIEQVRNRAGEQVKEPIRAQAAMAVGVFDTCGHLINCSPAHLRAGSA